MNDAAHKDMPLYQSLLGDSWHMLPDEIRNMHAIAQTAMTTAAATATACGEGCVSRGGNPLARFIAAMAGFPRAANRIDVRVVFNVSDGVEKWTRYFGAQSFHSMQYAADRLLVETFGPLRFYMALRLDDGKLHLDIKRWAFLHMPLPMFLCPRSKSYEYVADGKFHFHVRISHPLCGLIVHYHGWLLRTS